MKASSETKMWPVLGESGHASNRFHWTIARDHLPTWFTYRVSIWEVKMHPRARGYKYRVVPAIILISSQPLLHGLPPD